MRNVLFATDFFFAAESALPYALELARLYGSKVYAVHVRAPRTQANDVDRVSETGEGKVFEQWVGEGSVLGFEILPRPSERLCTQKPGWSIAC